MKFKKVNLFPNYTSSNPVLSDYKDSLDVFKDKPFWCNNRGNGIDCCFNDIIGRPEKNDIEHPIYDYELDVINKIEENRNVWIKKASGVGMTTLLIRYLTWKILVNNDLEYKNIFIISGTYVIHANDVKVKMENLFRKRFPSLRLESKFTDLWIKNTNIKIFPSRNVKDLRGYTDVSYLFIDEADHFEPSVNNELLHAITRYEEKSHCTTIMVSTPNRPGGLFQSIELDKNSKYEKIVLTYEVGLDKIYNRAEILKKKSEAEFPREYEGLYLGKVGNIFSSMLIDKAIKNNELVANIPTTFHAMHSVGIDPAWGSSNFGIVVTEHLKSPDIIRVIYANEFQRANPDDMINLCHSFHRKYWPNIRFYVDGANPGYIRQLKVAFDDSPDSDYKDDSPETNEVISVSFGSEHKKMLQNLYILMNKGQIAIPPEFDKLIISLRTAQAKEYSLDKEQTSYSDLLDGLRLSLKGYKL